MRVVSNVDLNILLLFSVLGNKSIFYKAFYSGFQNYLKYNMYQTLNISHKKNTYFRKYSRVYRNKMASVWTRIPLDWSVGQNDFPEKNCKNITGQSVLHNEFHVNQTT